MIKNEHIEILQRESPGAAVEKALEALLLEARHLLKVDANE